MVFYFWLQNAMQYYERKYKLLQDILSNIGGIARVILSVANVINYFASYYVTLVDSEELFITQNGINFIEEIDNKSINEKKIKKDIDNSSLPIKKMYYNNYIYQNNSAFFGINYMNKENINPSKSLKEDINLNNRIDNVEKNEIKEPNKNFNFTKGNNLDKNNYNNERKQHNITRKIEQIDFSNSNKTSILKIVTDHSDKYNKGEEDINNIGRKYNKSEFNFCKFLLYIICCSKNNKKMSYIDELRYKILSEETIVQSYLNSREIKKLSNFLKQKE